MNNKIDIKSAMIGLGIGVLAMLGVAATSSSGSNGRYQIIGIGNHGVIIDTDTGQTWQASLPDGVTRTDAEFSQAKTRDKN